MLAGQNVHCKYKFMIDRIDPPVMYISVLKESNNVEHIGIPMYLSTFGLYPPEINFVTPGPHLPTDHLDYHEPLRVNLENRYTGYGFKYGYYLLLDKNFRYTGKYQLIGVNDSSPIITKYAHKMSGELRDRIIQDIIGGTFEGTMIAGTIIEFLFRNKETKEYARSAGLVVETYPFANFEIKAYMVDPPTNVEFEFPVKLLTV